MKSDLAVAVFLLKLLLNLNFANSLIRRDYSVHAGKNITIPCIKSVTDTILWTRDGNNISSSVNEDNSLVFIDVTTNEAGLYVCSVLTNSSSDIEPLYQPHMQVQIKVKTKPGAVGSFRVRATTIIAVLIWEVWRNRTGNAPIIDFTAEMRKQPELFSNNTEENIEWQRLDPQHIAPNARQLEVYHLVPNTSYQFRIWASNEVGSGEIYTIGARTVPPTEEKDLIMRILEDAKEFKKEYWIVAVGIVMGTLLILTIGTTLILWKECRESSGKKYLCLALNSLALLVIFCILIIFELFYLMLS
ncbi:hypothetical protein ACKWTF_007495 [Chironomus riparius]